MYFDDKEGSLDQRKFRLTQIKSFSPTAQKVDFMRMDRATFSAIEDAALKEARANARNSGRLFMTTHRDRGGRLVEEFEGDIAAAFGPFMDHGYRAKLNKEPGAREETVKLRPGQRVQVVD